MANPDEVAVVTAGGTIYSNWETLEVERRIGNIATHIRLRVTEIGSTTSAGLSALRLKIGDKAAVSLAGRPVIAGTVTVRQVAYAAGAHQIEIVVSSLTWKLANSTPPPQQFTNSSLQQIANAITSPYGIGFQIQNAPGADKPFERVSSHVGETCLQFIEMLCRMRDVHLVDDKSGNLIGLRGNAGASVAQLVEGQNIEELHGVMSVVDANDKITANGTNFGNDAHWGDSARDVSATVVNPSLAGFSPLLFMAEVPGDKQDMAMRANHEAAANLATTEEIHITVPGWLMTDGSLWIDHVNDRMSIFSPMMFPDDQETLSLRGVTHRQSSERGTTTVLEFCLPNAISASGRIEATPDSSD